MKKKSIVEDYLDNMPDPQPKDNTNVEFTGNDSENQLQNFLTKIDHDGRKIYLSLYPQGDHTMIEKKAINLCKVTGHGEEYMFGGISESFYDKMVAKFDSNDKATPKQ